MIAIKVVINGKGMHDSRAAALSVRLLFFSSIFLLEAFPVAKAVFRVAEKQSVSEFSLLQNKRRAMKICTSLNFGYIEIIQSVHVNVCGELPIPWFCVTGQARIQKIFAKLLFSSLFSRYAIVCSISQLANTRLPRLVLSKDNTIAYEICGAIPFKANNCPEIYPWIIINTGSAICR